jgi:cell division protein ZapA (FtsZ GTPase activity inhibitor)
MPKKYIVKLTPEQRQKLLDITKKGKGAAREIRRAQTLLVEGELSVLVRQCLKQRIPNMEKLQQEVSAWEQQRNQQQVRVNWHFSIDDARIKLNRVYPSELMR